MIHSFLLELENDNRQAKPPSVNILGESAKNVDEKFVVSG